MDNKTLEHLNWIVAQAQPKTLRKFDPTQYRKCVPRSLDYIWQKFGVSSWVDGIFQVVDPTLYVSVMESALEYAPFIQNEDCVPYGIDAFGAMSVWHRKHGVLNIDFPTARMFFSNNPANAESEAGLDLSLRLTLPTDFSEQDHYKLFEACLSRFGQLGEGEVYGFVPALVAGGIADIDHVKKLSAPAHLEILTQFAEFGVYWFDGSALPGRLVPLEKL